MFGVLRDVCSFKIDFPAAHEISNAAREQLLALLPGPRRQELPKGDVHTVADFVPSREDQKQAYEEDDESEQRGGPRQAQCQSQ